MTPRMFFDEVVQPNMVDALGNPDDPRATANAILTMDALSGITFWYLHAKGDVSATKHGSNDSAYKADLANASEAFRVLRDAAFSLKHGKLTSGNRLMDDAGDMIVEPNVLGYFRAGDRLGSALVYFDLSTGRVAARDIIGEAFRFLENLVEGLAD
jgi:hypothetical protein